MLKTPCALRPLLGHARALAAALLLLPLLAACATAPGTGRTIFTGGLSEEGEADLGRQEHRSEEHTSELQSLMSNSYAVFCLKKKKQQTTTSDPTTQITTNTTNAILNNK